MTDRASTIDDLIKAIDGYRHHLDDFAMRTAADLMTMRNELVKLRLAQLRSQLRSADVALAIAAVRQNA